MPRTSKKPRYPRAFETFREPTDYAVGNLTSDKPTVGNQTVNVQRFQITIERIEETPEVYHERLQKMFWESSNTHDWSPLQEENARLCPGFPRLTNPGRDAPRRRREDPGIGRKPK